jgi:hypothetical protein
MGTNPVTETFEFVFSTRDDGVNDLSGGDWTRLSVSVYLLSTRQLDGSWRDLGCQTGVDDWAVTWSTDLRKACSWYGTPELQDFNLFLNFNETGYALNSFHANFLN